MILPVFVETLVWPVLDWGLALLQGCGHVLQGTLCSIPEPSRHFDAE